MKNWVESVRDLALREHVDLLLQKTTDDDNELFAFGIRIQVPASMP